MRLPDRDRTSPVDAWGVLSVSGPRAVSAIPIAVLLTMTTDGDADAVAVLERGRIVGIITRTDLIAALAGESLRGPP